jgi:hypothetical protein
MAIEQKPLEQRLGQILPGAAPSAPVEDIPLEPMPGAAEAGDTEMPLTAEPGTPSMEEGMPHAPCPTSCLMRPRLAGSN